MTWESGSSDQQRLRAGYAVLAMGVAILLCAWGLAISRGPESGGEAAIQNQKIEPPDPDRILPAVSAGMILYGVILIIILFVSLLAIYRLSRNYRKLILHKPSAPTPTADVWRMHKVPGAPDEQDADTAPPDGTAP